MAAKEAGMLVGVWFLARELAHREHLSATSYARHVALEEFYTEIVELADTFTETWQGRNRQLLSIPLTSNKGDMEILELLEAQSDYIGENRYKAVPKEDTCLQNIIDEVEGLYARTIYKLMFLS
jgi:hypothetical protein